MDEKDFIKRLNGVYRAVVVDNKDPEKLRRVKVKAQPTGTQVSDWVWPMLSTKRPPAIGTGCWVMYVGGDPEYPVWIGEFGEGNSAQGIFCHGSWHNTQTITALTANTAYPMQCDTIENEQGVTLVDQSKMTVQQSGAYNIQFSAQFDKSNENVQHAYIWLRKNGVNVPYSASQIAVQGSTSELIAAWNFHSTALAGDYFEVVVSVTNTSVFLPAVAASGIVPGIPSVILTINQIA
jgi:hypothetical protein